MNTKTNNPSINTIKNRIFRENNPEYDAEWRSKNREKIRLQSREYYKRHIEQERERANIKNVKRRLENPTREREYMRRADEARLKKIDIRLHRMVGNSVRSSIASGTKNNRKLEMIIGYSILRLKAHLEKQFKAGMSWNNDGKWHIDHKIPMSAFNFETPEDIDFKKCWALSNLQPLWAVDNLKKHNKLTKPFQPSLLIKIIPNECEAA
ncbi:MAG: hypothetical protein WC332_00660 [Clostridia bacterium]|jgi:hypothetical protein